MDAVTGGGGGDAHADIEASHVLAGEAHAGTCGALSTAAHSVRFNLRRGAAEICQTVPANHAESWKLLVEHAVQLIAKSRPTIGGLQWVAVRRHVGLGTSRSRQYRLLVATKSLRWK